MPLTVAEPTFFPAFLAAGAELETLPFIAFIADAAAFDAEFFISFSAAELTLAAPARIVLAIFFVSLPPWPYFETNLFN